MQYEPHFTPDVETPVRDILPEEALWQAVFGQYIEDLKAHQHWLSWPDGKLSPDLGEAWADFKGGREILGRLCLKAGLDLTYTVELITRELAGRWSKHK